MLNIAYTVVECIFALSAVIGNFLVLLVYFRESVLRKRTNYYIFSLALADFLSGLIGIPSAVLISDGWPQNSPQGCLFTISTVVSVFTISVLCIISVSIDRYWAILHPFTYSQKIADKFTKANISLCWFIGLVAGYLPFFGWHKEIVGDDCLFAHVVTKNFHFFLCITFFIVPSITLIILYGLIFRAIKQLINRNLINDDDSINRKREAKAARKIAFIVLAYMICWMPLGVLNLVSSVCDDCRQNHSHLADFVIVLSHATAAVNPVLYAYHLKDFRLALVNLLRLQNHRWIQSDKSSTGIDSKD